MRMPPETLARVRVPGEEGAATALALVYSPEVGLLLVVNLEWKEPDETGMNRPHQMAGELLIEGEVLEFLKKVGERVGR